LLSHSVRGSRDAAAELARTGRALKQSSQDRITLTVDLLEMPAALHQIRPEL